MSEGFKPLEQQLAYTFKDLALLRVALTHRSFSATHNERLEFLGDGVLNCAAAKLLYDLFPTLDEGKLSRIRSHLVRQDCLAAIGRELELDRFMSVGSGELKTGAPLRDSIVADALEAIFGAIMLDGGFDAAQSCVIRLIKPVLNATPIEMLGKDAKTRLQELLQARKLKLPIYTVLLEGGTAAAPQFEVECRSEELALQASGRAVSRRLAEQIAAEKILAQLDETEASGGAQAVKNKMTNKKAEH